MRRNTTLESAGAEFLVLGLLLAEGIEAHKTYTSFPGYDIIAVDPATGATCRIQVKSRFHTEAGGFPIKDLDACDVVAFVKLNRGYARPRKSAPDGQDQRSPDIYFLPISVVREAHLANGPMPKVRLSGIPDADQYRGNVEAIRKFLRRGGRRGHR